MRSFPNRGMMRVLLFLLLISLLVLSVLPIPARAQDIQWICQFGSERYNDTHGMTVPSGEKCCPNSGQRVYTCPHGGTIMEIPVNR